MSKISNDEFNKLGENFNKIADNFSTLLSGAALAFLDKGNNMLWLSFLIGIISFIVSYISHFYLIIKSDDVEEDTIIKNANRFTTTIFIINIISMILFLIGILSIKININITII